MTDNRVNTIIQCNSIKQTVALDDSDMATPKKLEQMYIHVLVQTRPSQAQTYCSPISNPTYFIHMRAKCTVEYNTNICFILEKEKVLSK